MYITSTCITIEPEKHYQYTTDKRNYNSNDNFAASLKETTAFPGIFVHTIITSAHFPVRPVDTYLIGPSSPEFPKTPLARRICMPRASGRDSITPTLRKAAIAREFRRGASARCASPRAYRRRFRPADGRISSVYLRARPAYSAISRPPDRGYLRSAISR